MGRGDWARSNREDRGLPMNISKSKMSAKINLVPKIYRAPLAKKITRARPYIHEYTQEMQHSQIRGRVRPPDSLVSVVQNGQGIIEE
jgi:hypothetical protein